MQTNRTNGRHLTSARLTEYLSNSIPQDVQTRRNRWGSLRTDAQRQKVRSGVVLTLRHVTLCRWSARRIRKLPRGATRS